MIDYKEVNMPRPVAYCIEIKKWPDTGQSYRFIHPAPLLYEVFTRLPDGRASRVNCYQIILRGTDGYYEVTLDRKYIPAEDWRKLWNNEFGPINTKLRR